MLNIKNIFKKKADAKPEGRIDFFKKRFKKAQQKKLAAQERRHRIREHFARAGLEVNIQKISKTFFNIAVLVNLAISSYLIYYFSTSFGITWGAVATAMIVLWVFVFIILIFALWAMFYLAVDLKIFRRKEEIEEVAKETMSGVDLKIALEKFASRYDSVILKRSVSMLNEGVEAGGQIGELLNRIATNIQEQKALMKEMSAKVLAFH